MGTAVGWTKIVGGCCLGMSLLLVLAGCGGKATGNVTGKVTYKDKPLVYGSVTIIGSDKKSKNGLIQPDGTFTVENVAVGEGFVGVTSTDPNLQNEAMKASLKGRKGKPKSDQESSGANISKEVLEKWFPISGEYENPEKSGITVNVKAGENTPLNINLTKDPPEKEPAP